MLPAAQNLNACRTFPIFACATSIRVGKTGRILRFVFYFTHLEQAMYTAPAIEDLIRAILGESATQRERHVLRESLLNLVRLAQVEQRAEIQASVGKTLQPVEGLLPA